MREKSVLPPLFFANDELHIKPIPIEYKKIDGGERQTWRLGIGSLIGCVGCFQARDFGLNCCVATYCCNPCIYTEAMRLAGVQGAEAAAVTGVVAGALRGNDNNGGLAAAADAAATFQRANVRQKLAIKLFGQDGRVEPYIWSLFLHCCCAPCSLTQEVDAIMTWTYETTGVELKFGPVSSCACTHFVKEDGKRVITPIGQEMVRG
tara:strand:+ start:6825 stop:7442 length:618 start_codon:yes stop_codon:yes gene_type:complete